MAALSVHSDPFTEVGVSPVKPLSQRVVRHALAIMHLLITEGDPVTTGDTALHRSLDQRTEDKKFAIDQIMKLVLGILHLLNEGPSSPEQTMNLSDEDWAHLEREQRELYSDLLTDNEQTLQNLGSFNVKTETSLGMEREDVGSTETPLVKEAASDPNGKLDPYSDASRSPVSSQPHTFLHPLKDGGHSFHESSDRTSLYGSHSAALSGFQKAGPNPCKDPYGTIFPDASSVSQNSMLSSYGEAYASATMDHFAVENLPIIHIKQEGSLTDIQPQSRPVGNDDFPDHPCGEKSVKEEGLQRVDNRTFLVAHGSVNTKNTLKIENIDEQVENISIIQIKEEASPTDIQPQTSSQDIDVTPETFHMEQELQVLCRKHGKQPKMMYVSRTHEDSKPYHVTRSYVATQETVKIEQTLKTHLSTDPTKSYWGKHEANPLIKKPFPCLRCEKSFNCRSHLIMHHRVHTRERPYVCECGKTFTQSSNLFRHQRGHRHHKMQFCQQQHYPCSQCDKQFPDLSLLVTHQKTHHSVNGGIAVALKTCDSQMG